MPPEGHFEAFLAPGGRHEDNLPIGKRKGIFGPSGAENEPCQILVLLIQVKQSKFSSLALVMNLVL